MNVSEDYDASIISTEQHTNGDSTLLQYVGDDPPEYVPAYLTRQ
jgi:hypothetical protein